MRSLLPPGCVTSSPVGAAPVGPDPLFACDLAALPTVNEQEGIDAAAR